VNQGTIYVDCPCCGARMEVRREDGKLVQHWAKPVKAKEAADLLQAAKERLEADKKKREKYLEGAKDLLKDEKRRLEEKFQQEKERIRREGDTSRPPNPFDLD
jgi:uncharacterized Zn finger protein (UPF0148 family)